MKKDFPLIFEVSSPGKGGFQPPTTGIPPLPTGAIPQKFLRRLPPRLPEVSEPELVRHYTALSRRNYGVDNGFYPLGSCTMKYNPKVAEDLASLAGFAAIHPLQPAETVQGALALLHGLEEILRRLTGMARFTLAPAAGAHGELTALLMIRAYHEARGDMARRRILVPDTAHGTNPASATVAGFTVTTIPSGRQGILDPETVKKYLDPTVAALMLTNPNTLGLFEREVEAIAAAVHEAGALLYYDGANFNALIGHLRPAEMGFDALHLNLHKTFATPHGGGGPGAGPVGVTEKLVPFLPGPLVEKDENGHYHLYNPPPPSIGRLGSFHGQFAVLVKAYAYLLAMGAEGLRQAALDAVLNANYLARRLAEAYELPYPGPYMHEFVLAAKDFRRQGIRAMDIAKRLIDYGFHPPTVYFPLIVEEAIMVEPTETESRATLTAFATAMLAIAREAREDPELLRRAPHTAPVGRLDEATAARHPILRWQPENGPARSP